MSVVVFLGPTLPVAEARPLLAARYAPPAGQGDVLRAVLDGAKAILVVDGYFERIPAVWHKEILFAMSEGVHVFGAASMGALRAAELADFGMEGVGAIYEAYASGELEDDDEVAVAHAAAEDGFRPVSEAMVNIRATLQSSVDVVSRKTAALLEAIAKELYYPDRSYPRLLEEARAAGVPSDELDRFREHLKLGRVDQKRRDARAALTLVAERLAAGFERKNVEFRFEHTDAWAFMLDEIVGAAGK